MTPNDATAIESLINSKFDALNDKIDTNAKHFDEAIHRVELQTARTNGRTTALEKWQIELLAREQQAFKDHEEAQKLQDEERVRQVQEHEAAAAWYRPIVVSVIGGGSAGILVLLTDLLLK